MTAGGKDIGTLAALVPTEPPVVETRLLPTTVAARAIRAMVLGASDDVMTTAATGMAHEFNDYIVGLLAPHHRDPAGPVEAASATRHGVPVTINRAAAKLDILTPVAPYHVWMLRAFAPWSRAATAANLPCKMGVLLVGLRWEVRDASAGGGGVVFDPRRNARIAVDPKGLDVAAVEAVVAAADVNRAGTFKLFVSEPKITTMLKDLSHPLGVATARAWVAEIVADAPAGQRPTLAELLRGVETRGSGLLYGPNADGKQVLRSKTPPVQSMAWAMFFVLLTEVVIGIDNVGVNKQLQLLREKLRGLCWDPSNTRDLHNKDRRATITELVRRAWILSAAGGRVMVDVHALHECSAGVGHAYLEARVTAALEARFPVRAAWPLGLSPREALNAVVDAPAGVAALRLVPAAQAIDINEAAVWANSAARDTGPLRPNDVETLSALARLPTDELAATVAATAAPATVAPVSFAVETVPAPTVSSVVVDILGACIIDTTVAWTTSWRLRKARAVLLDAAPTTVAEALAVVATAVAPIDSPLWAESKRNAWLSTTMAALVANGQLDIEPRVMPKPTTGPGHAVAVCEAAGVRFLAPPPPLVAALGLVPTATVTVVQPLPGGAVAAAGKWFVALDGRLDPVEATPTTMAAALAPAAVPARVQPSRSGLSIGHLKGAAVGGCLTYAVAEWPEMDKPARTHELAVLLVPVPRRRPDGSLEIRPYAFVFDSAVKSPKDASARVLTPKRAMDAAEFTRRVERNGEGLSWAAMAKREIEKWIVLQRWVPAGGNGAEAGPRTKSARGRRMSDRPAPRFDPDHAPPDRDAPGPKQVARALAEAAHRAPAVPVYTLLAAHSTLCSFFGAIMGADLPEGQADGLIEGVVAMQPTFAAWNLPTYEAAAFSMLLSPAEAAVVAAVKAKAAEARRSLANSEAVAGVLRDIATGGCPDCPSCARAATLAKALVGSGAV